MHFGSTYTNIRMIQRRLASPLPKDDTQTCERFRIFRELNVMCGDEGMNFVVIISQNIRVLNYHVIHQELTQFCISDFSVKLKGRGN